jgi:hypothetical protein
MTPGSAGWRGVSLVLASKRRAGAGKVAVVERLDIGTGLSVASRADLHNPK